MVHCENIRARKSRVLDYMMYWLRRFKIKGGVVLVTKAMSDDWEQKKTYTV